MNPDVDLIEQYLDNIEKMHDMRTPLNAVLGYTDLALASSDPSERQEYLEKIAQSGSILKELINDTLDLSRIESGKMSLKTEAVNFYDVIQKIVMVSLPEINVNIQDYFKLSAFLLQMLFLLPVTVCHTS